MSRQRDQAQQKDSLELELIALKKSMAGAPGYGAPTRRGSQVMFGGTNGTAPGPPAQQTSATAVADEVDADRLAGELDEAEEQISAMSSTIKQQVVCFTCVINMPVTQGLTYCLVACSALEQWNPAVATSPACCFLSSGPH